MRLYFRILEWITIIVMGSLGILFLSVLVAGFSMWAFGGKKKK